MILDLLVVLAPFVALFSFGFIFNWLAEKYVTHKLDKEMSDP